MAVFGSSGFYGFIGSARKTGRKVLNKAGLLIPEVVESFAEGFAGHGWKIWERVSGVWRMEVDEIVVRRTMTVFELLISKIRAIKGSMAITQASGKVKAVLDDGDVYLVELENDGRDGEQVFMEHDLVRCQTFAAMSRFYYVEVRSAYGNIIVLPKSEFGEGMTAPEAGDEIVQFGNTQYADRQSAIYLHADEQQAPAIDVMQGIRSKDWSGCIVARMGGNLPGGVGLNGFYCVNGTIKSVSKTGATMYELRPDGSGMLAGGAIRWDASGNFQISIGKNDVYGLAEQLEGFQVAVNGLSEKQKDMDEELETMSGAIADHEARLSVTEREVELSVSEKMLHGNNLLGDTAFELEPTVDLGHSLRNADGCSIENGEESHQGMNYMNIPAGKAMELIRLKPKMGDYRISFFAKVAQGAEDGIAMPICNIMQNVAGNVQGISPNMMLEISNEWQLFSYTFNLRREMTASMHISIQADSLIPIMVSEPILTEGRAKYAWSRGDYDAKRTNLAITAAGADLANFRDDVEQAGLHINGDKKEVRIVGDRFSVWSASDAGRCTMSVDADGTVRMSDVVATGGTFEGITAANGTFEGHINAASFSSAVAQVELDGSSPIDYRANPQQKHANTFFVVVRQSARPTRFILPDAFSAQGLEVNFFVLGIGDGGQSADGIAMVTAGMGISIYYKGADGALVEYRDTYNDEGLQLKALEYYKFKAIGTGWYLIQGRLP